MDSSFDFGSEASDAPNVGPRGRSSDYSEDGSQIGEKLIERSSDVYSDGSFVRDNASEVSKGEDPAQKDPVESSDVQLQDVEGDRTEDVKEENPDEQSQELLKQQRLVFTSLKDQNEGKYDHMEVPSSSSSLHVPIKIYFYRYNIFTFFMTPQCRLTYRLANMLERRRTLRWPSV